MNPDDTRLISLMLRYLHEHQMNEELTRLQARLQCRGEKAEIMLEFPNLPWDLVSGMLRGELRTIPTVVLPSEPPAKRGRVEMEESEEDSSEEEPVVRGVQEYMRFILDSVYLTAQIRTQCQISNFDTVRETSNPGKILRELEEQEKERRKEQLREEQQARQRKRPKDSDLFQGIADAFAGKRPSALQEVEHLLPTPVKDVVTLKDVLSTLEGDVQWRKSAILQRLYTCGVSERGSNG